MFPIPHVVGDESGQYPFVARRHLIPLGGLVVKVSCGWQCVCTTILLAGSLGAGHYRQTLVSTAENASVQEVDITGVEVTPSCPEAWSLKRQRLHGGKQEGVEVLYLDNGKLRIAVVPCRGLGLWSIEMGNWRIGWDSPVKEIVHPQFVNLTSRGGLGWLDGFGEFLVRCGLESNGHPGRDTIVDNTGAEATVDLTLHGKQAYLPAQELSFEVEREPPYTLRLRGRVAERMMHGPKLALETELSTVPGSREFRLVEDVVNEGGTASEFQLLYHINFGQPLLEAGSTIEAPFQKVTPFNAVAAQGDIRAFATYDGPTPGFVEQVYCARLAGDEQEQTTVLLRNRAGDRGVSLSYSLAALPYLTIWKNTAAVADGYVTGIEPGTNFPYNRRVERAAGRVPKLDPGARHHVELTIAAYDFASDLRQVSKRIATLSAGKPVEFGTAPEADPGHE